MDNEMIERVAKAMFCSVSSNYDPAKTYDEIKVMPAQAGVIRHYNKLAIAAIKAMREPTEIQLNAARDWSIKKYGRGVGVDGSTGCYQAMIDAIINE